MAHIEISEKSLQDSTLNHIMEGPENPLQNVIILIAAAVFIVLLFKRLRLSPVLGYFVAGAIIGEHGLNLVKYDYHILGEFGVVFLLFAIGLELTFERLKAMRHYVFGFGSLQVVLTSIMISGALVLFSGNASSAVVIGGGLALSSTAIVLQVVAENRIQATQAGRLSLAVLLMQDFAVVPLLVIVPLLAGDKSAISSAILSSFLKAIIALIVIFTAGRMFLRPVFGLITSSNTAKSNEIFIAATLLIVLSAAWATEAMGLSLALGAFVAGLLVAETEFQLQAEESIAPFKGLLLGLFFMTVGMTIDVREIYEELGNIVIFSLSLIFAKSVIIIVLSTLFGFNRGVGIHTGLLLSQGSEFAFILFNLGMHAGIIDKDSGKVLLLVVTSTMALTPLLATIGKKLEKHLDHQFELSPIETMEQGANDLSNHVVIAGFGRVGKMVAKMLEAENIHYIAIDINDEVVQNERASGFPIFKGDVSKLALLKAAGLDRALSIIISINNEVAVKRALKTINQHFPEVNVIVQSDDLTNAATLYESGATIIVPQQYEAGLQLGGAVLKSVGISEFEISRIKNRFRAGNYVIAKSDDDEIEEESYTT